MPSSLSDDYYALLGVPENANDEELRKAWRQLALQWHPDRAGEGATATFQKLSVAYAVLSDPIARATYDRRRRASAPPRPAPPTSPPPPPPPPPRPSAPAILLQRISGSLSSLLACGAVRHDDEPGSFTLVLREDEAAQGGMATVSMRIDLWCPDCEGKERSAGCASCGGKRTVSELYSAWLSVPPGVTNGDVLTPSVELPGMVTPVRFRVRLRGEERR
jgi:molecular chaperone DnaJ